MATNSITSVSALGPDGPNKTLRPSQRRWLQRLQDFVDEHLDRPDLQVLDLADAALVSERQLYRKLKKYTGLTPNAFVRARRLSRARELLDQNTSYTVEQLARQVGYHRPDYFSQLFVEEYGEYPLALIDN